MRPSFGAVSSWLMPVILRPLCISSRRMFWRSGGPIEQPGSCLSTSCFLQCWLLATICRRSWLACCASIYAGAFASIGPTRFSRRQNGLLAEVLSFAVQHRDYASMGLLVQLNLALVMEFGGSSLSVLFPAESGEQRAALRTLVDYCVKARQFGELMRALLDLNVDCAVFCQGFLRGSRLSSVPKSAWRPILDDILGRQSQTSLCILAGLVEVPEFCSMSGRGPGRGDRNHSHWTRRRAFYGAADSPAGEYHLEAPRGNGKEM